MFILFHLLTGLVIGYLLADRLGTRAVVLPCMLGALLPDLVDKPLGILIFSDALGSGRVYLHTLLFLLVLLLAGAVVYGRYRRPALLAVGLGVASHQALDLMWTQPQNWLYPFLGPFRRTTIEGWFLRELLLELNNPVEWLSAALLLLLLLPVLWPAGTDAFVMRYRRPIRAASLGAAAVLAASGVYLIVTHLPHHLSNREAPCEVLVYGAVLLLAAYAAYRLAARLAGDAASSGLK